MFANEEADDIRGHTYEPSFAPSYLLAKASFVLNCRSVGSFFEVRPQSSCHCLSRNWWTIPNQGTCRRHRCAKKLLSFGPHRFLEFAFQQIFEAEGCWEPSQTLFSKVALSQ